MSKTVKASDCSVFRMVAGGEKKHPVVIRRGDKMQWVGFGWVNEGRASEADKAKYPSVEGAE